MAETLSIVAIFVAFVAVWFTAEVVKRLNQRSDPSQNPFVIALAQGLEQKDRWIVGLDQRLKVLEGEVRALRNEDVLGAGRRPAAEIERDLDSIARGLRKARALQLDAAPSGGVEPRAARPDRGETFNAREDSPARPRAAVSAA
ncbi:MAG: hypothetical protein IT564_08690 [Rhodospirillales bacterium]|nr:hypothetical protein [Rhodospirillales bacterium]